MLETGIPAGEWGVILLGVAAAAVSGYFAIAFLLKLLKQWKLEYFAYYCWAVGLMGIAWFGLSK
jgi:undecaprenyl-diphosphatase